MEDSGQKTGGQSKGHVAANISRSLAGDELELRGSGGSSS